MALPPNWNDGQDRQSPVEPADNVRNVLHVLTGVTAAQLAALRKDQRWDTTAESGGPLTAVTPEGRYTWHPTSTLIADGQLVIAPADGLTGRFLLDPGQEVKLSFPFTFETADTDPLLTMPAGAILWPTRFWWEITTDFVGAGAAGVSSDVAGWNTKGDLLGGATGDLAATLAVVSSPALGTIGVAWDTVPERRFMLRPGKILRADVFGAGFSAGVGSVEMTAHVVANAGT